MAAISITEAQLYLALWNFITSLVDCPIVQGNQNRVAMPAGDFIVMTALNRVGLATTTQDYDPANSRVSNKQSKQWSAQIDCYGSLSADRAATLAEMMRTPYAADQFATSGLEIAPLFATDHHQMALVTGEEEYVERWTFEMALQYNPVITMPQDFASALSASVIPL
ncbi:MAG: hypothetical protein JWP38_3741 [Herbaspirillum sp.]|nr:hypothetical protein [Herbaspirillum sp.]